MKEEYTCTLCGAGIVGVMDGNMMTYPRVLLSGGKYAHQECVMHASLWKRIQQLEAKISRLEEGAFGFNIKE